MGTEDDFFVADGTGSGFTAIGRGIGHRTWFVVPEPIFDYGAQFQGWFYGTIGTAGAADPNNKLGPDLNSYSDFAGVWGQAVYVTGVAGTSTNNVGVYGQTEEDPDSSIPQNISAGVFGAANTGSGVVGWSTNWNGVEGWAYQGTAVLGVSDNGYGVQGASTWQPGVLGASDNDAGVFGISDPEQLQGPTIPNSVTIASVIGTSNSRHGVIGTSNAAAGVYGYSTNNVAVAGITTNPAAFAGFFQGHVVVNGTFDATVKNAVVPFPDGSRRLLHCMESPEHWFEDFGSAKLARGRAIVKLDANFAKVIKRGDYRVFVTPEGDCQGIYVHREGANSFEVRELTGGKSSIAFSYRIVGRRKDITGHRRFAKFDTRLPMPTTAARPARKPAPTRSGLRAFAARLEKTARERATKGAEKGRARMRSERSRPDLMQPAPRGVKKP